MNGEAGRDNGEAGSHASQPLAGQMAALYAENRELRAEIDCLKADKARLVDIQNRLMEALGTKAPERLVHDVRNVLNERELYRALADVGE